MTEREVLAEFEVIGEPATQGSKRLVRQRNGKPRMIESSKKTGPWRDSVSTAAKKVAPPEPFDGPLELVVRFRFLAPKVRSKRVKLRGGWGWRHKTPDLDKLLRAVFDSCQAAGLVANDSLFARIVAEKVEVLDGWVGATIKIRRLP